MPNNRKDMIRRRAFEQTEMYKSAKNYQDLNRDYKAFSEGHKSGVKSLEKDFADLKKLEEQRVVAFEEYKKGVALQIEGFKKKAKWFLNLNGGD